MRNEFAPQDFTPEEQELLKAWDDQQIAPIDKMHGEYLFALCRDDGANSSRAIEATCDAVCRQIASDAALEELSGVVAASRPRITRRILISSFLAACVVVLITRPVWYAWLFAAEPPGSQVAMIPQPDIELGREARLHGEESECALVHLAAAYRRARSLPSDQLVLRAMTIPPQRGPRANCASSLDRAGTVTIAGADVRLWDAPSALQVATHALYGRENTGAVYTYRRRGGWLGPDMEGGIWAPAGGTNICRPRQIVVAPLGRNFVPGTGTLVSVIDESGSSWQDAARIWDGSVPYRRSSRTPATNDVSSELVTHTWELTYSPRREQREVIWAIPDVVSRSFAGAVAIDRGALCELIDGALPVLGERPSASNDWRPR